MEDVTSPPVPMRKGSVLPNLMGHHLVRSPHMLTKQFVLSLVNLLPVVTLLSRLDPSGEEERLIAQEGRH